MVAVNVVGTAAVVPTVLAEVTVVVDPDGLTVTVVLPELACSALSPLYRAVTICKPADIEGTEKFAIPPLTAAGRASGRMPSNKVTNPVAVAGETVATKVMAPCPTVVVLGLAISVVVDAPAVTFSVNTGEVLFA
jgi:hypothetical protein